MASSSNLSLVNFTHDVFVNYCPEDTGDNFTSHLKKAFTGAGFDVAMNDMIDKGNEISDTLLSQISESLVSVVVFSKSYASCPDCLDELVKIMESQEENGRHVLPVFLGVEPSNVRKQTGAFGDGFHKLIQSEQFKEKKEIWRSTLMKTANLSGWDSTSKSEAKIMEGIVKRIMKILDGLPSRNSSNGFVGNYQVEAVKSMLQLQSNTNVQLLGIWGMRGIGKTTISEKVFHQLSSLFDASCYLENVTQTLERGGLQSLTEKMFSKLGIDCNPRTLNKRRLLIILDNVSNSSRLKSFVKEYLSYGRPGSRVILISRDEQVLKSYGCEHLYKIEKLDDCESRKLFEFHAFKEHTCQEMDERLLNKALSYCGGLPLALETLGCNLRDKNFEEWESELENKYVSAGELLLWVGFVMEIVAVVFEQLQYAFLGMVMAILGFSLSAIDFIRKVRKEQVTIEWRGCLPCLYSNCRARKPFGTVFEYFGVLNGMWQVSYTILGYMYARRGSKNPVNVSDTCLLMALFALFSYYVKQEQSRPASISAKRELEAVVVQN